MHAAVAFPQLCRDILTAEARQVFAVFCRALSLQRQVDSRLSFSPLFSLFTKPIDHDHDLTKIEMASIEIREKGFYSCTGAKVRLTRRTNKFEWPVYLIPLAI